MVQKSKKLLSVLLTVAMLLGLLPGMRLTAWAVDPAHTHDEVTFTEWSSNNSLPTSAGNYYLANDVTIGSTWEIPSGTVNLCLNGNGIKKTGEGSVINVSSGTTLNLYDCGTTSHYYTVDDGIATVGSGSESFTGGYITGGTGTSIGTYSLGGGIYVDGGTLVLNGGTILGNSSGNDGGGVWVGNTGTFNMTGGKIMYNKSEGGGAVTVGNEGYNNDPSQIGTFTMTGGVITKNTSTFDDGYCGGARANNGTIYVRGGSISDNIGGADVRINSDTFDHLHLSGPCEIGKVALDGSKVIEIDAELQNTKPIGILLAPNVFTSGLSGKGDASNFTSLIADKVVKLNDSNEAMLVEKTNAHTHDEVTFTEWSSNNSLPTSAGSYYLAGDVTISSTWTVPSGTVNLCLNGHGIIGSGITEGGAEVIQVPSGATLTVTDCSDVTHSYSIANPKENGAGLATVDDAITAGHPTFTGGYITNGAGVLVQGAFHLVNGTIIGNYASGDRGGGVHSQGIFTMTGGSILGNKGQGGAVRCGNNIDTTMTIEGGSIMYNISDTNGGFHMDAAGGKIKLDIKGGEIAHNYGQNNVGGIEFWAGETLNSNASFHLSGSPLIYDNIGGNANNVFIFDGVKISVDDALTNTTPIGISMKTPGVFTKGGIASSYISNFTSDDTNYTVQTDGNELKLGAAHTHSFSYALNDAGDTITASCTTGCNITTGLTLSIAAPADLTYDGSAKAATLSTGYNTTAFPGTYAISYAEGDEALTEAPKNAGSYTASVTVGTGDAAKTASVSYAITKAEIDGAVVELASFPYGADNVPTPTTTVTTKNNATVPCDDEIVTYYYQATAFLSSQLKDLDKLAETEGVYTSIDSKTFNVGQHYVLTVVKSDNFTRNPYVAQGVFTVEKSSAIRPAPEAPTVDGTTVTVDEKDRDKTLEYSLDGTNWLPVVLKDGTFTAEWPDAVENAQVWLRETANENYGNPTSSAKSEGTVTTTTYTVTYDANGGKNPPAAVTVTKDNTVTVSAQQGMTRTGFSFNGWRSKGGESVEVGSTVNSGMTLYAQWTANTYTVRFNANGGTGEMQDLANVAYDTAVELPENAFTRTDYTFLGWSTTSGGKAMYTDMQTVKNLAVSGTVTLFAVWTKDNYTISGKVFEIDGTTEFSGVTVELKRGDKVIAATTSGTDGSYSFKAAPAIYNIVASKDGATMTELIDLKENKDDCNLTMPAGDTSSKLEVQGAETPAVVVGGLENVAADEDVEDRSVVITMTVKAQSESENADAESIKTVASDVADILLLDISVKKDIYNGGPTPESTEAITDTGANNIIEIVIPYDFSGKSAVKVYRCHNGVTVALTEGTAKGVEGTYLLDRMNGFIYVYANKFSTYAIGYTVPSVGGGGGAAATYMVTAPKAENGTVSIDRNVASSGTKVTITVTPKAGYRIGEVVVKDGNGNTVAVTKNADGTYSYIQPASNVTISVSFIREGACPQDSTCPMAEYPDLKLKEWYHDGIHWALEKGVMNGAYNGSFMPDADTTRAMVVVMLWRLENSPAYVGMSEFSDVRNDLWYGTAIRWASAEGIVVGYDNGNFGPDDSVTREQLAIMLYRYAQYKGMDLNAQPALAAFPDANDVQFWSEKEMNWMVAKGVINGMYGKLSPQSDASRAQIATMFKRFCEDIAK